MSHQLIYCMLAATFVLVQSLGLGFAYAEAGAIARTSITDLTHADEERHIRLKANFQFNDLEDEEDFVISPQIDFRHDIGQVTFLYEDDDFESVAVSGSFNDWIPQPMMLDSLGTVWTVQVDLEPGRYLYRFVVRDEDGEWEAIDPNNDSAKRDSEHGWVSRFRVRESSRSYRTRTDYLEHTKRELDRMYGEFGVGLDYQRVDGLVLYFAPGAYARHRYGTSLKGRIGYGFRSEDWSLSGTLAQPLLPDGRLQLLLSGYAGTAYTDQSGVGDLENIFATVLFKEDFRDYFWREGFSAQLVYTPYRLFRIAGGFRTDDYTSLVNKASWSLGSGDFIPNPPVQEGTMRSVFGEAQFGSEATHVRVNYETAGEHLAGGDFEFDQLTAQLRQQTYLGRDKRFDMRVKYGTTLSGWLPNQRRYLVGGLGTVRGYDYQSLLVAPVVEPGVHGGQQMFLANAEIKLGLNFGWSWIGDWDLDWEDDWEADFDFDLALFFDTGMAWADKNAAVDFADLKSSAGVGLLFGDDDDLRLDIIHVID
ncbi:MAG: BamA/TamA family outer membrane protein, partial [Candidatus Latescibacterota bacterium]